MCRGKTLCQSKVHSDPPFLSRPSFPRSFPREYPGYAGNHCQIEFKEYVSRALLMGRTLLVEDGEKTAPHESREYRPIKIVSEDLIAQRARAVGIVVRHERIEANARN